MRNFLTIALFGLAITFSSSMPTFANSDTSKISRFPVTVFDELPKDLQKSFSEMKEKRGFVPNVFYALAYRPEQLCAFIRGSV